VTDDFYDKEIASKSGGVTPNRPWMLYFLKDRFNKVYKEKQHNKTLDFFMDMIWQAKHSVYGDYNFGFVDMFDDGENLKETFDITLPYIAVFIKDGKFYPMYSYIDQAYQMQDIVEFLDLKYQDVPAMQLRQRVDGIWIYGEYATSYLTEKYFNEIVQSAYKVRSFLKNTVGLDIDFKAHCPLFGKKNKAKKA
jgi:hypothetical protein